MALTAPKPIDDRESMQRVAEAELRRRLGIPPEAERVLIFGETSHWDPNWLHTSAEYYALRIEPVIDAVIAELKAEPRRVFSLESLFFLQMYWERRPERHQALRELIDEGRLRLTGSGITTPDTVLPATEALLRDYLYGQQWLRERGLSAEPRLAYLPDDFGYSPALPSVMRALGYDRLGITRIDGMHFVGCDYRLRSAFPRPGSSAELLQHRLRSADFVWRAPDGAEVLCHWNAFTYFQGDMLAYRGIIRWMGRLYGVSWRSERHVARRIAGYAAQLQPLARTPYLFCPIGCDFNDPIPGLLELLDRYNERRFAETGLWVSCAGMDDYLALVDCHRAALPTVELDPNPYWMGFYASRPEAKIRCNRIVRKLVLAEKLLVREGLASAGGTLNPVHEELRPIWDKVVLSNHHDFVTGTSPDRIWLAEQRPLLRDAEAVADRTIARSLSTARAAVGLTRGIAPRWRRDGSRIEVTTAHYRMVIDEDAGGCIVSWRTLPDGQEMIAAPANDLVAYRDSGGLWRLGHEFRGGVFREQCRSSASAASVGAVRRGDLLEIEIASSLCDRRFLRRLWLRGDVPIVRMQIVGAASRRRTVTCRFPTTPAATELTMNVPGGVVTRPQHKLYSPTFWPARSFVHWRDRDSGAGVAAFLGGPACVALAEQGVVEWLVLRYAPCERAFGCLPILAHPASGTDPQEAVFDYAVLLTPRGDYRENRLPQRVRRALRAAMFPPRAQDLDDLANSVVVTDHDDVLVSALKPASHGEGLIVRLRNYGAAEAVGLRCAGRPVRAARLCDALERDLGDLPVARGAVRVPLSGAIATVRLLF